MMSALDKGRVGIAALAVGIAQAGLEAALDYATTRKQFGKRDRRVPGPAMDARRHGQGHHRRARSSSIAPRWPWMPASPRPSHCSMAKCFAADMAVPQTANAVQIFGGSGYIRGFEVERLYRDAKITQIYEGTNQIQRSIIARELLTKGIPINFGSKAYVPEEQVSLSQQQSGQPQGQRGYVGHQAQHDQHRNIEDQDAL